MSKRKGTHWVISASLTETGAPAYFQEDGTWSAQLNDAQLIPLEDNALKEERLSLAATQEAIVCDPYAFPALPEEGKINPLTMRETIRAFGPTTRLRRPDGEASKES